MDSFKHPIIGQKCVCPDGVGFVADFRDDPPHQWIKADTHYNNKGARWDPKNIKLIKINYDA